METHRKIIKKRWIKGEGGGLGGHLFRFHSGLEDREA